MRSTEGLYLDRIDHLRGWAALMVLFYHGTDTMSGGLLSTVAPNLFTVWLIEGHTAVSLFIVLSGFILTIVSREVLAGGSISYRGFIYNRFLRIVPLLLFVTAIAVAAHIPQFRSSDLLPLLTLQLYAADALKLGNEWAVGTEFQAYFVFPLFLLALRDQGVRFIGMVVALMVLTRLAMLVGGYAVHNGTFYHVLIGRLDQFAIGMGAAVVYLRMRERALAAWLPAVAIAAALVLIGSLLIYGHSIGSGVSEIGASARYGRGWLYASTFHAVEGVLWATVLLGYLLLPIRSIPLNRLWMFLGEISFSIYLLHAMVLRGVGAELYSRFGSQLEVAFGGWMAAGAFATLIFGAPLVVLLSWLSYNVIEKPALAFRRPYLRPRES